MYIFEYSWGEHIVKKLGLITAVLSCVSTPAFSQDSNLDEIIITAQKRDQNIQDVPLAVTAYDTQKLEQFGVQQFDDLAALVPGLEVQEQSANNPGFVIRGITSDSGDATIEPRVSIYQNGVSISRSRGSFVEIMDSQVEVIRGPQPTLFGRSALIGAINVTSNKPDFQSLSGQLRVGTGNFDYQLVDGHINVPLSTDKAAARIALRYKKRDGYVENLIGENLNGFDTFAGRLSLAFKPSDDLNITLIGGYQSDDNPGTAFKSGTFLTPVNTPVIGSTSPFEPAALSAFGNFHQGRDLGLDRTVKDVTALINYTMNGSLSLSSISSYRVFESFEVFDPDGFEYELFSFAEDSQSEQFSQELRLNIALDNKFSGFIGASYFDEEGFQRTPLGYTESITQALLGGFLFTNLPGRPQNPAPLASFPTINVNPSSPLFGTPLGLHSEEATNFGDTQSWDLFADGTYSITDRLDLTAGLRYTWDNKKSAYAVNAPTPSALTGAGIFLGTAIFSNGAPVEQENNFDGLTGRFGLTYDITKEITFFGNYARGRRPEIINYQLDPNDFSIFATGQLLDNFQILPTEDTTSYEIGLKSSFFDGALYTDASAYLYDYENFQSSIVNNASGQIQAINAGRASAFGIEASLFAQPHQAIEFFALYAYTDATFDDVDDAGNAQRFGGNRFRLTPKQSLTLGGTLSHSFDYGHISLTPIYKWKSRLFFDNDNDSIDGVQDEFQKAYGLIDISLKYMTPRKEWHVDFSIKNATNKKSLLDAGNVGGIFGIPTFIPAPPRHYNIAVTRTF